MHRRLIGAALVLALSAMSGLAFGPVPPIDLATTLQRVGERVEQHFTRAQSLMCLERVDLHPLGGQLGALGLGRRVESELRVSWDPLTQVTSLPEARMLREVLKVNGRAPRRNDPNACTTPEQDSTETHPLSMLLPGQQSEYRFSPVGRGRVDQRAVIVLDYKSPAKPSIDVHRVAGTEDCISFSITGGTRGRLWIDAETYDVLRLDHGLNGLIDIAVPPKPSRRHERQFWTLERLDTSIRFKPVNFQDPEETLTLPVSLSSLMITRGAGTPQLRTMTEYSNYKRFLTGGRIVKE